MFTVKGFHGDPRMNEGSEPDCDGESCTATQPPPEPNRRKGGPARRSHLFAVHPHAPASARRSSCPFWRISVGKLYGPSRQHVVIARERLICLFSALRRSPESEVG